MIADELKSEAKALSKRESQIEQLRRDLSSLPTTRELAWLEIQNGVSPAWVALKYGYTVEEIEKARAENERRETERRGVK